MTGHSRREEKGSPREDGERPRGGVLGQHQ